MDLMYQISLIFKNAIKLARKALEVVIVKLQVFGSCQHIQISIYVYHVYGGKYKIQQHCFTQCNNTRDNTH